MSKPVPLSNQPSRIRRFGDVDAILVGTRENIDDVFDRFDARVNVLSIRALAEVTLPL